MLTLTIVLPSFYIQVLALSFLQSTLAVAMNYGFIIPEGHTHNTHTHN